LDHESKIITFLDSVGIITRPVKNSTGFLKGVRIVEGELHYDIDRMDSVGDLLHEAGHVATVPIQFRKLLNDDVYKCICRILTQFTNENPVARALLHADECEAVAWSYMALRECRIPANIVFHPKFFGGKEEAIDLLKGIQSGCYFGFHGLQVSGMCRRKNASQWRMIKWTQ
jgi:hypothetical protein